MPLTDRTSVQGFLIGLPLQPGRLRVLGDVLAYHLLDRPLSTCHAVLLQCQTAAVRNPATGARLHGIDPDVKAKELGVPV